jgi:hypothetical protein
MKNLLCLFGAGRVRKYGLYLTVMVVCIACAGQAAFQVSVDELKGKEWRLKGIQSGARNIVLDRQKLEGEGFPGVFTLVFEDGQVHGRGAPNTYRAPCEEGQNHSLSIGNAAATLMAPLREPEDFKEGEYFTLLGNVYRWELVQDDLKLYTKTEDGKDAILVFGV